MLAGWIFLSWFQNMRQRQPSSEEVQVEHRANHTSSCPRVLCYTSVQVEAARGPRPQLGPCDDLVLCLTGKHIRALETSRTSI